MNEPTTRAEATVRITNPTGLHARPAVRFAQLAARFDADIQLRLGDGPWVRAKSVGKLMKLKATVDTELQLRASGDDAERALAELVEFVARDFDEPVTAHDTATAAGRPTVGSSDPDSNPEPNSGANSVRRAAAMGPASGAVIAAQLGAPGLALGPLYPLAGATASPAPEHAPPAACDDVADRVLPDTAAGPAASDPQRERARLRSACRRAAAELQTLSSRASDVGREILAFQYRLLDDPGWLDPADAAIADGADAPSGWRALLDAEIADYEAAGDELFRARAADLRDLRDRVLHALTGAASGQPPPDARSSDGMPPEGAVVVADELTPSQFLSFDWNRLGGAATRAGSYAGHTALLARAAGVPLLIGLQLPPDAAKPQAGATVLLQADADDPCLILAPGPAQTARAHAEMRSRQAAAAGARQVLAAPARSADGSALTLYINAEHPDRLAGVDPLHCDGIGLTRTELLFGGGVGPLPDEQTQYLWYRRLLDWADGRPVTVRTLDAGGDKPIVGLTLRGESNPFLGVRGLRLSLRHPAVFSVQLRALLRAAAEAPGRLKVMLPMVTAPDEVAAARRLLTMLHDELRAAGIAAALPPLGIMIEVPAAALAIERFEVDFYSIGSNDLIQYCLAVSRDSDTLRELADPLHPAVLELIGRVVRHGRASGREVSLCGEMAADPRCLPALLQLGLTALSVPPAALGAVKAQLTGLPLGRPPR